MCVGNRRDAMKMMRCVGNENGRNNRNIKIEQHNFFAYLCVLYIYLSVRKTKSQPNSEQNEMVWH